MLFFSFVDLILSDKHLYYWVFLVIDKICKVTVHNICETLVVQNSECVSIYTIEGNPTVEMRQL